MERRLVSDPLLRSRMLPLLSFLAPSIPPLWRSKTAFRQLQLLMPQPSSCRASNIHTTARQRNKPSSSAADLDFLEEEPAKRPTQSFQSQSAQKRPTGDVIGNQLNNLIDSTFHTPNPAIRNPLDPVNQTSDAMIQKAFQDTKRPRDYVPGSREIALKMQFPYQETAGGSSMTSFRNANQGLASTKRVPKAAKRTVRSCPAVGRTIEVVPLKGVDFGRALRNLGIACAANKVRADQMRQRFHERPGMKRKRLKSERWRKMFKESFKATVARVREMRRKGW